MTMRRLRTLGCLAGLAAVLGFAALWDSAPHHSELAGQTVKKTASGDEAAIRAASKEYVLTMVKGELDPVMAYWADDADYIDEAGKTTRGKDKIAALFKESLPQYKDKKVDGKISSIKFLRPEICLVDGSIDMTGADGVKESGRYAVIWTNVGGKWLISSVRDLPTEVTDLPSLASVQLKGLEWLVGEWQQSGAKGGITLSVRWDINKSFLLMDYTIPQAEGDSLKVSARVGWDPVNARIRSWLFDSNGGFGESYWKNDGKRWVAGTTGILPDGGTGGATNTVEFVDQDHFTWKITDRDIDGLPLADAEVKLTRKPIKK